jgi:mRNA interferase MazF
MARYSQGDILYAPFPYSDFSRAKKRPLIVISKNSVNNKEYIVAKISTVPRNDHFTFKIDNSNVNFILDYPSEIRTGTIFTISEKLILEKRGCLKPEFLNDLLVKICANIL